MPRTPTKPNASAEQPLTPHQQELRAKLLEALEKFKAETGCETQEELCDWIDKNYVKRPQH
jgi:hypothetical protein